MGWAEAKWVVDTVTSQLGRSPNNMRAFNAVPLSQTSIGLNFIEPNDSTDSDENVICTVSGVMIRVSTESYPQNTSEGLLVIDNKEPGKYEKTNFVVDGLIHGTTYYFTAFPYSTQKVYNLSHSSENRVECATL